MIFPFIPGIILGILLMILFLIMSYKDFNSLVLMYLLLGGTIFNTLYFRPGLNAGDISGLLMVAYLLKLLYSNRPSSQSFSVNALLVLFVYIFLSNISVANYSFSNRGVTNTLFYFLLPLAILAISMKNEKNKGKIPRVLIVSGALMLIFGYVTYKGLYQFGIQNILGNRFSENVPNLYRMGNSVWFLLAALSTQYQIKVSSKIYLKIVYAILLTVFLFGVIASGTRSTLVAVIIGLITFYSLSSSPKQSSTIKIFIMTISSILFYIFFEVLVGKYVYQIDSLSMVTRIGDISNIGSLYETLNFSRIQIWTLALESVAENLLFGVGLGNWGEPIEQMHVALNRQGQFIREMSSVSTNTENIYIMFIVELGLIGIILLVVNIISASKTLYIERVRTTQHDSHQRYYLALLGAMFYSSLVRAMFYGSIFGAFDLFLSMILIYHVGVLPIHTKSHINKNSYEKGLNE
jgi:hypothetical protein